MSGENEVDISLFKQYLLGNLAPDDAEAIDLQIIADKISEETLSWAESELIEDYLEKTLAPPEIERFEVNFLASPERRRHLQEISLIKDYAQGKSVSGAEKNTDNESENFFQKLINLFTLNLRPAIAVCVLIVIGLGAALYFLTANHQTAGEKEFAAINSRDLSDSAEYNSVFAVNLANGTFRGADGAAAIKLPTQADGKVLFKLAIPQSAADTYKVELFSNQKVIFTQTGLRLYDNPNGRELRFFLPAALLGSGRYQIKATAENSPNSVFTYNFALE